jgi:type IV fimbrial biogenesis protein FimT
VNPSRHQQGVNLVELMVTLGVFSLSVAMGIPSFQSLTTTIQRDAVLSEFTAALRFARSEAGRRGVSVTVCPSADRATCAAGDAPDWNTGWITFVDLDDSGALELGEQVLSVYETKRPDFSLRGDDTLANGITFGETGFPVATGTLNYCDRTSSNALTLSFVGRLSATPGGGGCS